MVLGEGGVDMRGLDAVGLGSFFFLFYGFNMYVWNGCTMDICCA